MKKAVFLTLAMVGLILVGFTSCSKECECTTYLDGEKITTFTVDREKGKKCKDYNVPLAFGTETKCK